MTSRCATHCCHVSPYGRAGGVCSAVTIAASRASVSAVAAMPGTKSPPAAVRT